jgi:hypothetical protein
MRYYGKDSKFPSKDLATAIRHITKTDQGRLKGHYLIGLEILEEQNQKEKPGETNLQLSDP